jgi:hypothetical protein
MHTETASVNESSLDNRSRLRVGVLPLLPLAKKVKEKAQISPKNKP